MHLFLLIASAHFLALLAPGPDFFLIARSAARDGWRAASGACLGIALANGLFIALAFAGLGLLREGSRWFLAVQVAGGVYLVYVGGLFVRHASAPTALPEPGSKRGYAGWRSHLLAGLLCALLNPKNALFYASLASVVGQASLGWLLVYAGWMFSVVLLWDLLIAVTLGHPRVLQRWAVWLPGLQRVSGVMLIGLGLGVLWRAIQVH